MANTPTLHGSPVVIAISEDGKACVNTQLSNREIISLLTAVLARANAR